jgi:hypothetical protein
MAAVREVISHGIGATVPTPDKRNVLECITVVLDAKWSKSPTACHGSECQRTSCRIEYMPSIRKSRQ